LIVAIFLNCFSSASPIYPLSKGEGVGGYGVGFFYWMIIFLFVVFLFFKFVWFAGENTRKGMND
jgi:hypothetical protein